MGKNKGDWSKFFFPYKPEDLHGRRLSKPTLPWGIGLVSFPQMKTAEWLPCWQQKLKALDIAKGASSNGHYTYLWFVILCALPGHSWWLQNSRKDMGGISRWDLQTCIQVDCESRFLLAHSLCQPKFTRGVHVSMHGKQDTGFWEAQESPQVVPKLLKDHLSSCPPGWASA